MGNGSSCRFPPLLRVVAHSWEGEKANFSDRPAKSKRDGKHLPAERFLGGTDRIVELAHPGSDTADGQLKFVHLWTTARGQEQEDGADTLQYLARKFELGRRGPSVLEHEWRVEDVLLHKTPLSSVSGRRECGVYVYIRRKLTGVQVRSLCLVPVGFAKRNFSSTGGEVEHGPRGPSQILRRTLCYPGR